MNENVVLYSKNECPTCKQTKRYLNSLGVKYTVKNIDTDEVAKKELLEKNFKKLPVTFVNGKYIQGFNKRKFDEIFKK